MPRRRTVDLRWNAILSEFRRSGLTQAEFCRRRDLPLHTFRKHLYRPRLDRSASAGRPAPSADDHFFPVTILPAPNPSPADSRSHLELILPTGHRIAVAPGFDPDALRHLIAVVEGRPCSG
jgi:hypothetical protein